MSLVDKRPEEESFLEHPLPVEPTPFPMVLLTNLRTLYAENLAHLSQQIAANIHDYEWSKELKASKADVEERLRSVRDITAMYSAKTSAGKEKGKALLVAERDKALDLYATFIKKHPKG